MRRKTDKDTEEIRELKGDRKMIQARKSRIRFRILDRIFLTYTKILLKTCKFEIENKELFRNGIMFGFWHEDCYSMELVLDELSKSYQHICAVVTASTRGDYIEDTLRHNGGEALRIPDGMEMKTAFKQILEAVKKPELTMAIAFDGPSGPYRDAKKLLFMLAKESGKEVVYAHFTYKRVFRLKKRWDNYVIPLPFARVTAQFESLGYIDRAKLSSFEEWKGEIQF